MRSLALIRTMSPWSSIFRRFSTNEPAPIRQWYPMRMFKEDDQESKYALVLLNSRPTPDSVDAQYIMKLWPKANIRACADGGANRLAKLNKEMGTKFYPDIICGDLDSALPENVEFFKQKGTKIHHDPSQISTDYTKTCRLLAKTISEGKEPKVDTIVTVGGLHGRFDHVMGCVQTLFLLQHEFPKVTVYCVLYRSMFMLLPHGRHTIHVDENISSGVCGLVPIGAPAGKVTTTGFEWNLNEQSLAFGSLVSTSNHIKSPRIQIITDAPLLLILNLKI